MEFSKPTVVASNCLGFASCRWNGQTIRCDFVRALAPHVEFRPVCPECEIGLGIPRPPIRVVSDGDELRLMQPETGRDCSADMRRFADEFLSSLGNVDGFILKSRSPSCGIKDVKVYPGLERACAVDRASGFFGAGVLQRFDGLAVEDEGRLTNYDIREQFLTKLFALARLREVAASGRMRRLVEFQTAYKLVLMAYDQEEMRALGRIVANPDSRPFGDVVAAYAPRFRKALAAPASRTAHINVLMHALGHFSEKLAGPEKAWFLELLERYRACRVPLSSVLTALRGWIVRFDEPFLKQQCFFEPYPETLVEMRDSGKGVT